MRVYLDHMTIRILGTVLGVGFIAIGLYAIFAGGEEVADYARERAAAFGMTAIIGGVLAIFGSWAEQRVHQIWCAPPRSWRWLRRGRSPTE